MHGHVTDFVDFHWAGWHWPAFNLADVANCFGAALVVVASIGHREPRAGASVMFAAERRAANQEERK